MFLTHLYFQSKIRREWRDLWPHLNVGYNTRVKSLLKVEIYTKPGENDAAKVKASSLVTAAGLRQTAAIALHATEPQHIQSFLRVPVPGQLHLNCHCFLQVCEVIRACWELQQQLSPRFSPGPCCCSIPCSVTPRRPMKWPPGRTHVHFRWLVCPCA